MYFYAINTQQNTNATPSTDTLLLGLATIAGLRVRVVKMQAGNFSNAIDNQIRLQLRRLATVGSYAAGSAITPQPKEPDGVAAFGTASSLPTLGTGTLAAVSAAQIAYNTRGTGLWAAFVDDEKIGMQGAASAVNGNLVVDSQATGATVAVPLDVTTQE